MLSVSCIMVTIFHNSRQLPSDPSQLCYDSVGVTDGVHQIPMHALTSFRFFRSCVENYRAPPNFSYLKWFEGRGSLNCFGVSFRRQISPAAITIVDLVDILTATFRKSFSMILNFHKRSHHILGLSSIPHRFLLSLPCKEPSFFPGNPFLTFYRIRVQTVSAVRG